MDDFHVPRHGVRPHRTEVGEHATAANPADRTDPARSAAYQRFLQIDHAPADDIAAEMSSGTLSAGSRLPSAQELAEIYGVARLTARRAIQHLEDQRLVLVRPGKGTFVNRTKP